MSDRKVFQDSVTPLPDQAGVAPHGMMVAAAKPQDQDQEMTVLFSLSMPDDSQAKLEAKIAKGETVTPSELKNNYGAKKEDVDSLVNWLKGQGYKISQVSPNGTGVYAKAKVSQIQQSLDVRMVRVTKDGLTYTAAQNAPSMPSDVGKSVHAIIGLQPFRQANKHRKTRLPKKGNRGSLAVSAAAPNIANSPPYLVEEILKAYNADNLGVTGKGQTIAILIDTFPDDNDLQAFWQRNNLPVQISQIQKVNVKGDQPPPAEGEETLDTQWTSGIAPGATIRIYASGSLSFVDLDMAIDQILADLETEPGMRQLSVSLGLGEQFMGGPQGEVATQHQKFLRLAAAGVNVFVSTGDAGSNPDETGHSATGPTQAEYASSDPAVIAVGGTSLTLGSNGDVSDESGWTSGGGGKSIFFQRPAWQKGNGMPAGDQRLVPDVSLTADPNEGAMVILNGNVMQIGGTSWSAPVWAGFCALINEARINAGKPALPFLNPLIYPLQNTACFRDIKSGNNGAFDAGSGYDLVTGIGVPDVKELINSLTK